MTLAETTTDPPARCHVLVVEDSATQRMLAMRRLTALGYSVSGAEDGEAALDQIAAGGIDIVLSDWMMPKLDGIGLCRAVRSFADSAYVYFVLMTARSEGESLAEGLDAGADDFIAKPMNAAELSARLAAGRRLSSLHRRLNEAHRTADEARRSVETLYAQIQQDLTVAAALQHATLPPASEVVNGCPVAGFCRFSGHVGGDHIGWLAIGPDAVGVYSIDVAGHGIASCLLALRLAALMAPDRPDETPVARRGADGQLVPVPPAEVLQALNHQRFGGEEHDLYFTMAYAVLVPSTGAVEMATAGHWPPAILSTDGSVRFVDGEGGPPVGLIDAARYASTSVTLGPGERLVLYSDGLPEAPLPDGGMLGSEGLAALLGAESHRPTAGLPEAIWQRGCGAQAHGDSAARAALIGVPSGLAIDDDASLLVIERPAYC